MNVVMARRLVPGVVFGASALLLADLCLSWRRTPVWVPAIVQDGAGFAAGVFAVVLLVLAAREARGVSVSPAGVLGRELCAVGVLSQVVLTIFATRASTGAAAPARAEVYGIEPTAWIGLFLAAILVLVSACPRSMPSTKTRSASGTAAGKGSRRAADGARRGVSSAR